MRVYEPQACDALAIVDVLHYFDAETQERDARARARAALRPGGCLLVRESEAAGARSGTRAGRAPGGEAIGWNRARTRPELPPGEGAGPGPRGARPLGRAAPVAGKLHPGNVLVRARRRAKHRWMDPRRASGDVSTGSERCCCRPSVRAPTPWLRRAIGWARDLDRLGVDVPLTVVHDLGLVLCGAAGRSTSSVRGARSPAPRAVLAGRANTGPAHARYVAAIQALDERPDRRADPQAAPQPTTSWWCSSCASSARRTSAPACSSPTCPSPSRSSATGSLGLRSPAPRDAELALLARFVERLLPRLRVLLDTIDLDTLELLSVFGQGRGGRRGDSARAHCRASRRSSCSRPLSSLQANDVVNFSLELLPSVLETTRRAAPGTYAVGGYQGLARRGSLDSMVLTELAWDDEELARRLLDDEVLFHARERAEDQAPRVHLVLVDASASMRGDRTTFARGVAIALAKRLELEGEEARIRFFDSAPLRDRSVRGALARARPARSLAASLAPPHPRVPRRARPEPRARAPSTRRRARGAQEPRQTLAGRAPHHARGVLCAAPAGRRRSARAARCSGCSSRRSCRRPASPCRSSSTGSICSTATTWSTRRSSESAPTAARAPRRSCAACPAQHLLCRAATKRPRRRPFAPPAAPSARRSSTRREPTS